MKRYGNLYKKTFSLDALYQAYLNARRGKRSKLACFRFERNLGQNIYGLHRELASGTYRPDPLYSFVVYEPKTREIQAPVFRDCVVQHAIYKTIYPIFDPTFSRDTYACRRGFGTHAAADRMHGYMRGSGPDEHYIEMDIRKFFPSIDHHVMEGLLARKIKDKEFLRVMVMFFGPGEKGLPIGCLLSQINANIYLNEVDNYCKREMKVRKYARYMDNFACVGFTRDQCLEIADRVYRFVSSRLNLGFSKVTVQKIKHGFNFVGYRTWQRKRFIRKRSIYNFSRALRTGRLESVTSILGHALRTGSLNHLLNMAKERNHELYLQIPESLRRLHYIPAAA